MKKSVSTGLAVGIAAVALASVANAQVRRPSGDHLFFNFIPFGGSGQVCTQHQVFDASLWSGPMEISALGFSANPALNGQQYESDIVIKLGYTNKIPGQSPPTGLDSDLTQNPNGAMTEVFNARVSETIVGTGSEDFSFILRFHTPWCYDPSQGNLLVEIFSGFVSGADLSVSRTAGSAESSRAYNSTRFGNAASPTTATRMDFYEGPCQTDPTIETVGDCPGVVGVFWSNCPPNQDMAIVFAYDLGSFTVPGGVCGGTELGVTRGVRVVFTGNTGPNGSGETRGEVPECGCGRYLQMVIADGTPCTTTNVAQIP